jgi:hypothetical protein
LKQTWMECCWDDLLQIMFLNNEVKHVPDSPKRNAPIGLLQPSWVFKWNKKHYL